MGTRSTRRTGAWLALVAMLASFALPAHATLMRTADKGPQADLCVGGKAVPAAPAMPGAKHDCATCCASTSSAAAPPPSTPAPAVVRPSASKLPAIDLLPMPSGRVRAALARGPPILL